jgi:hypothetical protein
MAVHPARRALPIATLVLACLAVAFCQRPSAVDRSGSYAAHIRAGAESDAANVANAALNQMDSDYQ